SLHLGAATGHWRTRSGHVRKNHYRPRLAAQYDGAWHVCGDICHRDRWPAAGADDVSLLQGHRLEIRRQDDFQQFTVVRVTANSVLDLRRLDPARTGVEGMDALSFELAAEPALEYVDHLEVDVVIMRDRHLFRGKGLGHPDDVRLHHAVGRFGDAEIAIG